MDLSDLTLIIPAKYEHESLPIFFKEINKIDCKKLLVLEFSDTKTISVVSDLGLEFIIQKKTGYGSAIKEGISHVKTRYFCIINADGSMNPNDIYSMFKLLNNYDFIFASRYCGYKSGSEDDSILTFLGNKFFTSLGRLLFRLNLSDILYTFIIGEVDKFNHLILKNNDFRICVEIPVQVKKNFYTYLSYPVYERRRIAGSKKVNEFKDGFLILLDLLRMFFTK
jgi:hypothetical protein